MNKIPLIIGLGKTGVSLAKYLSKSEESIYILDSSPSDKFLRELNDLDVDCILNPEVSARTFDSISIIYPSPGISMEHDAFMLAKSLNIPIQTDIDIFLKNSRSYNILVTGTNGKTTTASMLEHLLREYLKNNFVSAIGNIGKPVLDSLDQEIDIAIIEISSFQIEASSDLDSEMGILLNIEEDHIDRHRSFEIYKSLKTRVLKESSLNISKVDYEIEGKQFHDYENYFPEDRILNNPIIESWPVHDVLNLKAALVALKLILQHKEGIDVTNINSFLDKAIGIIASFKKQPHRFEVIERINDILHINDSKATNFDATLKCIESCRNMSEEGNIFLICGGDLKGQKLNRKNASHLKEVNKCFIYGKDKEILKEVFSSFTNCFCCDDLDSAYLLAKEESRNGDIIVLSPACSSTDMFTDYRERGDRFKELLKQS